MSIIINGKVYNSNNMTIINDRVVNGKEDDGKKIDETKAIKGNVKNLVIVSGSVDVRFIPADTEDIIVHLKGSCSKISSVPVLDIKENDKEIKISIEFKNKMFVGFMGSISLEIMLPSKAYDSIAIIAQSSDISSEQIIKCNLLNVSTISGDIDISTNCGYLDLSTTSGDINVKLKTDKKAFANLKSVSGDVDLELINVSSASINNSTCVGDVINRFRESSIGFPIIANISTTSGDIKIS